LNRFAPKARSEKKCAAMRKENAQHHYFAKSKSKGFEEKRGTLS
jgi:hypothetical protein